MKLSFGKFFQPIRKPTFFTLFLAAIPLVTGILLLFINPGKLAASDFLLIAWNTGQELLKTGTVYAGYPYPLWTVVVLLPFTVWPAQTAMLLWFISNVLMLAASLAILVGLLDCDFTPAGIGLVVVLAGFFLPVLTSFWLGQLTIFSLFILALTTSFFLHQRWTWLGIVLGLSFIKPQVMVLLAGLLLLWALWQRRWQTWLGFGAVVLVLTLISLPFISSPAQIIGGGIGTHLSTYIQQTSTLWGLLLSLGTPWTVPLVICLVLLAWLGWIWLPILRGKNTSSNRALFLFSAAMLVNLIAIPYSWMHNMALLLLPFGYGLSLALRIKNRSRFVWLAVLFIIMQPLMLGLFLAFQGSEHTQTYQVIPALVLLPCLSWLEFRLKRQGQ